MHKNIVLASETIPTSVTSPDAITPTTVAPHTLDTTVATSVPAKSADAPVVSINSHTGIFVSSKVSPFNVMIDVANKAFAETALQLLLNMPTNYIATMVKEMKQYNQKPQIYQQQNIDDANEVFDLVEWSGNGMYDY